MVDIGLGTNCNNCCVMCTNIMPTHRPDPSYDDIINELSKLDQDVDSILLTGGEPTIREDFYDILDLINDRFPHSIIKVITNARMFAYDEFIRRARTVQKLFFITELYGSTPELHDSLTQTSGSFSQSSHGIKNLLANGFPVELRMVISKLNYLNLPELARLYVKEFSDARRVVIFPIDIIGNAFKNKHRVVARYSDIRPYVERTVDILKEQMEVSLYHIPYCVLDEKYHEFVTGVTVLERRVALSENCRGCRFEDRCPRVWTSYLKYVGSDEFQKVS